MKKIVLILALCAFLLSPVQAQATDALDLVMLFDTSESLFAYYDDVVEYIVSYVIKDFARIGDSFHLISFSDTPQIEIAQKLQNEDDIKKILGRLYLLYPLGKSTDLISSLRYLYQYLSDLPSTNSKSVVIITDGIHNPGPASPFYKFTKEEVLKEIENTAIKIRQNGWKVVLIKVPLPPAEGVNASGEGDSKNANTTGTSSSETTVSTGTIVSPAGSNTSKTTSSSKTQSDTAKSSDGKSINKEAIPVASADVVVDLLANSLGTKAITFDNKNKEGLAQIILALPKANFPTDIGIKEHAFTMSIPIENIQDLAVNLELKKVIVNGENVLTSDAFLYLNQGAKGVLKFSIKLPESFKDGQTTFTPELVFANSLRVNPNKADIKIEIKDNPILVFARNATRPFLFIILLILVIAICIALLFMFKIISTKPHSSAVSAVQMNYEETKREEIAQLKQTNSKIAKNNQATEEIITINTNNFSSEALKSHKKDKNEKDLLLSETNTQNTTQNANNPHSLANASANISQDKNLLALQGEKAKDIVKEKPLWAQGDKERNKETPLWAQGEKETAKEKPFWAQGEKEVAKEKPLWTQGEKALVKDKPLWAQGEKAVSEAEIALQKQKEHEAIQNAENKSKEIRKALMIKKAKSIQVELIVEEQNSHIGLRNVHNIKSGNVMSLGSHRLHDYLLFVIKVPGKIGELVFDGDECTFYPLRLDLFPELKGPVTNCLGKTILVKTKNDYVMHIQFKEYENPAEKVNKLLKIVSL